MTFLTIATIVALVGLAIAVSIRKSTVNTKQEGLWAKRIALAEKMCENAGLRDFVIQFDIEKKYIYVYGIKENGYDVHCNINYSDFHSTLFQSMHFGLAGYIPTEEVKETLHTWFGVTKYYSVSYHKMYNLIDGEWVEEKRERR
jgi:hypothetical protein